MGNFGRRKDSRTEKEVFVLFLQIVFFFSGNFCFEKFQDVEG